MILSLSRVETMDLLLFRPLHETLAPTAHWKHVTITALNTLWTLVHL